MQVLLLLFFSVPGVRLNMKSRRGKGLRWKEIAWYCQFAPAILFSFTVQFTAHIILGNIKV